MGHLKSNEGGKFTTNLQNLHRVLHSSTSSPSPPPPPPPYPIPSHSPSFSSYSFAAVILFLSFHACFPAYTRMHGRARVRARSPFARRARAHRPDWRTHQITPTNQWAPLDTPDQWRRAHGVSGVGKIVCVSTSATPGMPIEGRLRKKES